MVTSWAEIIETDEYSQDVALLKPTISNAIAFENDGMGQDDLYIDIAAHLMAVLRYSIRHLPEQKDLDKSQYLDLIQKQIGVEVPLTDAIPVIEFLRETKRWYGGKGTEQLYSFISKVIGSAIQVRYPSHLIFKWDSPRSCWSGKMTGSGMAEWDESKLARFRDGIYWANYVYVLKILQAQNLVNYNDFSALIENIHPAATQRFIELVFNYFAERRVPTIDGGVLLKIYYWTRFDYPTWDNNWIFSGSKAKWSMHGGNLWKMHIDVTLKHSWERNHAISYRTHERDTMMHKFLEGRPHTMFSRQKENPAGGYTTLYSDTDQIVFNNAQNNMGMNSYEWDEIKDLTYQETRHVAFNEDQKSPSTTWFPWFPRTQVRLHNGCVGRSVVQRVQQNATARANININGVSIVQRVTSSGVLDVSGIVGVSVVRRVQQFATADAPRQIAGVSVVRRVQQAATADGANRIVGVSVVQRVQQSATANHGIYAVGTSIIGRVQQHAEVTVEINASATSVVQRVRQIAIVDHS